MVREKLVGVFSQKAFTTLVCSAACGADLLALDVAAELDLDTRIILPFEPAIFRKQSVIDRPGEWGLLFDRIIERAQAKHGLQVLGFEVNDQDAFSKTNEAIVSFAHRLAGSEPVASVLVWDEHSRGSGDATQEFEKLCQEAGFYKVEISTL